MAAMPPIEMVADCDCGNVVCSVDLAKDCAPLGAFGSTMTVVTRTMSNRTIPLHVRANVGDSVSRYCASTNNDSRKSDRSDQLAFVYWWYCCYVTVSMKPHVDGCSLKLFRRNDGILMLKLVDAVHATKCIDMNYLVTDNVNVNANGCRLNWHPHRSGYFDMLTAWVFWALTVVYAAMMHYISGL